VTLAVITCIASPYQVELFDALARLETSFRAIYSSRRDRSRNWTDPVLRHDAVFLDETRQAKGELLRLMDSAELVVFADYSSRLVRKAMRRREAVGKPWCFWGERPGYHGLGYLGWMRRRILLAPLHRDHRVPIWGIGKWAVEKYREEFGDRRAYWNVPYFSDLARFRAASARRAPSAHVRIVYSGALVERKGVDLLAKAFRRLARTHEKVSLSVIGAGPLRPYMERILGSGPRVLFHDFVPWDELPTLYAAGDVLCAPSRYDGWGLIVPEGMAAGMPVVATARMGSALELVEQGTNGWLVRANDEDHLYEALREAVDLAPSRRTAMGLAAQTRAGEQDIAQGVPRFRAAMEGTLTAWRRSATPASLPVQPRAQTTL
jgi:glycosyltransferase involved in cell wall biosynthesis